MADKKDIPGPEQTGKHTPLEQLQQFLAEQNGALDPSSMEFPTFFRILEYDWRVNTDSGSPRTLDNYLKTSIYNAASRRIGLEHQDEFHIEIYHWDDNQRARPESVNSRVEILTGTPFKADEKLYDYAKRLRSEDKATFEVITNEDKSIKLLTSPLTGLPDFGVVVRVESEKQPDGKYGVRSTDIDVKVPYEIISEWLAPEEV